MNQTAGRALYYFLAESANSATDPLVLWLNGGPGCSSIGGGLMSELGPFYPDPNGPGLVRNTALLAAFIARANRRMSMTRRVTRVTARGGYGLAC